MSERAWLEDLAPGDDVVVERGYGHTARRIESVDRVTATQIVIGQTRFRRRDGRRVGGGSAWESVRLVESTPAERAQIRDEERRLRLASRIADVRWRDQPMEVLVAVDEILRTPPKAHT